MKIIITIIKYLPGFILGLFLFSSCDDYLDKTPEAEIGKEDIFSTYPSFSGFIDAIYPEILSPNLYFNPINMNWGGESWCNQAPGPYIQQGDYLSYLADSRNLYHRDAGGYNSLNSSQGIWTGGWRAIRRSNMALANLHLLKGGTEEEQNLIAGQAYFFRAYHHGEIISSFGGMPYIDTVFSASDEMRQPRLSYHECTERIIEDLDKAINLLPEDWDETVVGSERLGANLGRITKGAAIGYKQKFLLYAGSPLMNGSSGNTYTYNEDYCKRSAAAGWELIKLANKGVYNLVPWEDYSDNFYKTDGTTVWTSETILARLDHRTGTAVYNAGMRRNYVPIYLSDNHHGNWPNQLFVDRFEMADGTRYKIEYDYDDNKRWRNRDPRFYKNFYVDRDKVGNHPNSVVSLYYGEENVARPLNRIELAYCIAKYWPFNVNKWDKQFRQLKIITPRMRLAEVYLSYAEAVTVAYGPNGKAPSANLSAVDAVNIIRERAGMPPITADASGYDSFLELVRNERAVELAFEDHYWFDIRRWYIAHLPEYKDLVDLEFDKDWTYFNRKVFFTRVFELKHYWMPIFREQSQIYEGMYQNPGW